MSQADIETLRAAYEAVSRRDWDAAFRGAHPDLEWKVIERDPLAGTYRGSEEIRRYYDEMFEPFEEVVFELEEFFERGDRIVVFFRWRARPRGSTAIVENRAGHLWTMRDGKAVRCEFFPVREDALEAAGLKE
jgi:hypothetical protein